MNLSVEQMDLLQRAADTARARKEKYPCRSYPGDLTTHCKDCGELLEGREFCRLWDGPFGPAYDEQFVETCFCANCETIHQTFRRRAGKAEPEHSVQVWKCRETDKRWSTEDAVFENGVPGGSNVEWMNGYAENKQWMYSHMIWCRKISGPIFQRDEPIVLILLPVAENSIECDNCVKNVREYLNRKKLGGIKKKLAVEGGVGLVVGEGLGAAWTLRSEGKIPLSTTTWRLNGGRLYEVREWDSTNRCEMVPALVADLPMPVVGVPRLFDPKVDPLMAEVETLLIELEKIAEENGELRDSAVRESIFGAIEDGFIYPVKGFKVPSDFSTDDKQVDKAIQKAIKKFIAAAGPMAISKQLSGEQLMEAVLHPNLPGTDLFGLE